MTRYSDTVRDQYGRPIHGAKIYVYDDHEVLASLTEDGGSDLANPVTSDEYGGFYFNAADGLYSLEYRVGGKVVLRDQAVMVGQGLPIPDGILTALGLSSGAALIGEASGGSVQQAINKLATIVTPDQFGAVGDNVTDDLPAFNAAIAYIKSVALPTSIYSKAGVRLHVPNKKYFLNGTWDIKGVTLIIEGEGVGMGGGGEGSVLRFPLNTTGIRIQRFNTIGNTVETLATFGSDATILRGLTLQGGYGASGDAHGVHLRARALVENCVVRGFGGHGIYGIAAIGGGGSAEGNVNGFKLSTLRIESCGLDGVHITGSDANIAHLENIDASFCGRYAFNDRSLLGITMISCHADSCGLAGYANNGTGSSVVHFGGSLWWAYPNQLVAAKTTQPGTNPAVWRQIGAGGPSTQRPTWTSGMNVVEGGPYRVEHINARTLIAGCYAESGMGPSQIAARSMIVGGFHDETGVIGVNGGTPGGVWLTNFEGTLSNPGGFFADNGTRSVRIGYGNYLLEMVGGQTPGGHQWQYVGNDLRMTYGGSDGNEFLRITGPSSTSVAGTHAFTSARFAVGGGSELTPLRSQSVTPTGGQHPNNTYVFRVPFEVGQPRGWFITNTGAVVADAVL